MSGPYSHLFSPGKIGGVTLRNRVVMAPIDSIFTTEDGASNERHRAYLAARAKGGVGLIISDNMAVEFPRGATGSKAVRIDQDRYIAALSEVAEDVHFWGAQDRRAAESLGQADDAWSHPGQPARLRLRNRVAGLRRCASGADHRRGRRNGRGLRRRGGPRPASAV